MANGTCTNLTGEIILVYGDKSLQTPQDKDNALYQLPSGRKTPLGWDCDGIFVPTDRLAIQSVFPEVPGPVAVKYGLDVVDVSFEITRRGGKYFLPPNQGVFTPAEVRCPSKYPQHVCWNIPGIAFAQISAFPEVIGHLSAIDGKWQSNDTDKRFSFEVAGKTFKWTERGTQSTSPGQMFVRSVDMNWVAAKFRVERPNEREALDFLGFKSPALQDAILAKGPKPSFITFLFDGSNLLGEWNGLSVTKKADGTLNELVQPGSRPPRTYTFVPA